MDYMLEPPEPSKKETWVENKVEEWVDGVELFIDAEATGGKYGIDLYDFLNWDKLREALGERADELYEDMVGEAQIAAWEAKQESRWLD